MSTLRGRFQHGDGRLVVPPVPRDKALCGAGGSKSSGICARPRSHPVQSLGAPNAHLHKLLQRGRANSRLVLLSRFLALPRLRSHFVHVVDLFAESDHHVLHLGQPLLYCGQPFPQLVRLNALVLGYSRLELEVVGNFGDSKKSPRQSNKSGVINVRNDGPLGMAGKEKERQQQITR